MKRSLAVALLAITVLSSACQPAAPTPAPTPAGQAETSVAATISAGQTSTAAVEQAVRMTLTAAVPSPTNTLVPSSTPTPEPTTAVPPTDTLTPTATKKPAIQPTAPPPSPTSGEKDLFVGNWVAVDKVDGSGMTLTISRNNGSYSLVLVDDKASACGRDEAGNPKFAVEIRFTGTARGNVLNTTSTSATCLSDPPSPQGWAIVIDYTYQTPAGTLIENGGQVWSRR